jgi:hypothetical protein
MSTTTRYGMIVTLASVCMFCGCRNAQSKAPAVPPVPAVTTDMGCLVKAYRPDGSCYVTRQNQNLACEAAYLRTSGIEPDARYSWQLNAGMFTVGDSTAAEVKWLPAEISPMDYCRLVLACLQAEPSVQSTASPVRVLGNWAYPARAGADDLAWYSSSPTSSVADIVVMQKVDGSKLAVRGFGYSKTRGSQLLPSKIELYWTSADSSVDKRLVELDYLE